MTFAQKEEAKRMLKIATLAIENIGELNTPVVDELIAEIYEMLNDAFTHVVCTKPEESNA